MEHKEITKAIIRSQHCQRNWDLSREVPQEDLDLLITAATQCPSKQNVAFYRLHVITNRQVIESVHEQTKGFTVSYSSDEKQTNSQVLANMLFVFEERDLNKGKDLKFRNEQTFNVSSTNISLNDIDTLRRDKNMAVGIAAGYVNLTASLLGYATGCCACFDPEAVRQILDMEKQPLLLMGIGHKNPLMNRRVHHNDHSFVFPTKTKQDIEVRIVS
jgi:nitroreductase